MKDYHAAILAHDGAMLSGLFLPDANLWPNVLTMPDVFQVDDRGAVDVAMPDQWPDGPLLINR